MQNSKIPVPLNNTITEFQKMVLQLTVDGFSVYEIADSLGITELKVEVYQLMLMKKFRVENISQMVRLALEHGLAS